MKRLILFICLVALIQPVFPHEKTKDSINIGYYVFIKKCDSIYRLETQSIAEVYAFINVAFPDFCSDLIYITERSLFYHEFCFKREIYVEKKQVTKKGKYKRLKIKKQNIYL